MVRELLKLGLPLPAREAIEAGIGLPDAPSEYGPLQQSLRNISGDPIPWSQRRECFESNLQAFSNRDGTADLIAEAWSAGESEFQLFRDGNGIDQVRARSGGGYWRWNPFLGHHQLVAQKQALPDGVDRLTPGPYLFDGLELGGYFKRIFEATLEGN